jgi:hypothetical protein
VALDGNERFDAPESAVVGGDALVEEELVGVGAGVQAVATAEDGDCCVVAGRLNGQGREPSGTSDWASWTWEGGWTPS